MCPCGGNRRKLSTTAHRIFRFSLLSARNSFHFHLFMNMNPALMSFSFQYFVVSWLSNEISIFRSSCRSFLIHRTFWFWFLFQRKFPIEHSTSFFRLYYAVVVVRSEENGVCRFHGDTGYAWEGVCVCQVHRKLWKLTWIPCVLFTMCSRAIIINWKSNQPKPTHMHSIMVIIVPLGNFAPYSFLLKRSTSLNLWIVNMNNVWCAIRGFENVLDLDQKQRIIYSNANVMNSVLGFRWERVVRRREHMMGKRFFNFSVNFRFPISCRFQSIRHSVESS